MMSYMYIVAFKGSVNAHDCTFSLLEYNQVLHCFYIVF